MRRTLVAALLGALVVTGLSAAPATAASKKPSKVGLVSFVAADYNRKTNRTTLTLDWPDARRARSYEIFVSRYPSMKKAKRYKQKSSKTRITKLRRGTDYYFQVRGVNRKKHGSKSSVVAKRTILRPGPTGNLMPVRVMTYDVCSDVCDVAGTAPDPWLPTRQAAAQERMTSSAADVIAAQEAGKMTAPPSGYAQAIHYSAKRIYYNTARFDLAPGPLPTTTMDPKGQCRQTSELGLPTGVVFLGRHSSGCRYAVWAELVERATGRSFLMVDVHTVSGFTKASGANRRAEIDTLLTTIRATNVKGLKVVYAGDFNSHRTVKPADVVAGPMNGIKFYDSYELARRLLNQHNSSYNDFRVSPVISTLWGNHIDKVWVNPYDVRVDGWYNFALLDAAGRMVTPIPSDHSPVVVDLRIG